MQLNYCRQKLLRQELIHLQHKTQQITVQEAYQIQIENINKKVSEGQRIIGKKIGLTSEPIQKMLGVNEPDYGHLLDGMIVENGGTIDTKTMLQPKVEGEIAFILKKI